MSTDSPQYTIRAAHVPSHPGETIANPSRSLAKVELTFPELTFPEDGREYSGSVILFVREDGNVLGQVQGFAVTFVAHYLDTGARVEDITHLEGLAQSILSEYDLPGIWQDSRMNALYYEALLAARRAKQAYAEQQELVALYEGHVNAHYSVDPDGGDIVPKVTDVDYLVVNDDGTIVADEEAHIIAD